MNKFFALIGFLLAIVFFGLVLSSTINRNVWKDWINVVITIILVLYFAYYLRSKY